MKIDYELVEKIGATHYAGSSLYKVVDFFDKVLMWDGDEFLLCDFSLGRANQTTNFSKIPPKPQVHFEYEKVTESIFDLKDELARGELYCKHEHAREHTQITNTQTLAQALHGGFCYRKVEKEIDWRDVLCQNQVGITPRVIEGAEIVEIDEYFNKEQAIELARDILRATGEL